MLLTAPTKACCKSLAGAGQGLAGSQCMEDGGGQICKKRLNPNSWVAAS